MLATFAFDVCHDVYRAAREVIDTKIPTLNAEISGKYQWRPDRMPRLAEFVCDFVRAGERALGEDGGNEGGKGRRGSKGSRGGRRDGGSEGTESSQRRFLLREPCSLTSFTSSLSLTSFPSRRPCPPRRASRMAMFRVYYLGGAEYHAARRHLGISEFTWADWADEIRRLVGRELTRSGVFPPSRYFRETSEKAS
jgi:hypothetical protein